MRHIIWFNFLSLKNRIWYSILSIKITIKNRKFITLFLLKKEIEWLLEEKLMLIFNFPMTLPSVAITLLSNMFRKIHKLMASFISKITVVNLAPLSFSIPKTHSLLIVVSMVFSFKSAVTSFESPTKLITSYIHSVPIKTKLISIMKKWTSLSLPSKMQRKNKNLIKYFLMKIKETYQQINIIRK